MQWELMAAQLSLIIRGGDLQDPGHTAGSIDSRLHRRVDGLLGDAVDHYLKYGGDILGQSAHSILAKGCAEGGVGGGLEELVLGAHLGATGHHAAGKRSDASPDPAYGIDCRLGSRQACRLVLGQDQEVAPGYAVHRSEVLLAAAYGHYSAHVDIQSTKPKLAILASAMALIWPTQPRCPASGLYRLMLRPF